MAVDAEYESMVRRFAEAAERLAGAMSGVARSPNDETAIDELLGAVVAYREAFLRGRDATIVQEATALLKSS
ncbi:MAG: hypothetical protein JSR18_09255 [Proteobacteria bacterium]|nr:hypothetical protein [Pseudomonadota bacterium]